MPEKKWYVLYSKPRWEKKIDAALIRKGIESWCPLSKIEKQWSDRKKIIEEPLFKSYVFIKINQADKAEVLTTPGVLNFVYYLGKAAIIKDEEIELIKRYLSDKNAKIELVSTTKFKENTKVKISQGVFLDSFGTVVKESNKKIYVQIESLGQVMIVEFKSNYLISV